MLVVRNSFMAKPGQASKLAAQLKEAAGVASLRNARVLTDVTGGFNTVVLEYEAANLAEFESRMQDYATNQAFRDKMTGYTDHWISGQREVFRIE